VHLTVPMSFAAHVAGSHLDPGTEATSVNDSKFAGDFPVLGMLFEAASLACGILGKQLMRLGHLRGLCWVRVLGLLLQSAVSPFLDALALVCAAQAILVLFGGLDAAGTLLVAPFLLGEQLSRRKVLGAVLVGLGTISAAASGPKGATQDPSFSLDQLQEFYWRPNVGIWAAVFALVAGCCFREVARCGKSGGSKANKGLACGILVGMFSGNSWFLKTVVRLIAREHPLALCPAPLFWLTVAGAAGSALLALCFMVRGTAEFETVFLVPVIDGSRIISGAASGFFVLDEGNHLPPAQMMGYLLGVLAVLLGMQQLYIDEAAKLNDADHPASQELVTPSEETARELRATNPNFGDMSERFVG